MVFHLFHCESHFFFSFHFVRWLLVSLRRVLNADGRSAGQMEVTKHIVVQLAINEIKIKMIKKAKTYSPPLRFLKHHRAALQPNFGGLHTQCVSFK